MQTETSTAIGAPALTPGIPAEGERKPSRQRLKSRRDCAQLLARYVRRFMDGKCKSEDLSRLAHTLTALSKLIDDGSLAERVEALEAEAKQRSTSGGHRWVA